MKNYGSHSKKKFIDESLHEAISAVRQSLKGGAVPESLVLHELRDLLDFYAKQAELPTERDVKQIKSAIEALGKQNLAMEKRIESFEKQLALIRANLKPVNLGSVLG